MLPLNGDLTLSEKKPHKVNHNTEFYQTPYRIEVETGALAYPEKYRIIRTWNENHLPPKSIDPSAPIEHRIDVSPSQEFSEAEKQYVGQSDGHKTGDLLIIGSFVLFFWIAIFGGGWWLPEVMLTVGVVINWLTKTPGDPIKAQEVNEGKERLRREAERQLQEAMRNVRAWAALDGLGFEHAVARIYREQGFDVELTPRTNDQGVDLILKKNGKVSIVQCKAYSSNVGVSAIRELAGARASWLNAEEAILVTLYDFSSGAKHFAAQHGITLFSVTKDYLRSDYRPER